jgi:hypothetical protein
VALGTSETGAVVFGRNPEATDVLLEHPSISRRHAAVLHDGKGGLFLYEFGSTHGTFLDGRRVPAKEALPLKEGSCVKFAESSRTYILRLPVSPATAAAASVAPADSKEALEQLPLAFGGSKKTFGASLGGGGGGGGAGPGGALSKDAMAAGIAEMMKEIEAADKKRQDAEEAAANGKGQEEEEEEEEEESDEDDDFGPAAPSSSAPSTTDPGEAKAAAAAAAWRARAAAGAEGEDGDGAEGGGGKANGKAKHKRRQQQEHEEEAAVVEAPEESVEDVAKRLQVPMSHEVALRGHHKVSRWARSWVDSLSVLL